MKWFHETSSGAYLAHNAVVTGEVRLGLQTSVWFGAVIRGDVAPVVIGERVNIQDGSVVHCDSGYVNTIEGDVTIGHRAVVHGERVGRGSLIGIGAILMGHTVIGEECMIGAGAVVPPGMQVPDRSLIMGVPGRIVRAVKDEEIEYIRQVGRGYIELVAKYLAGEFGEPGSFMT